MRDKCKLCAWLAEQCMNGPGCLKPFRCIVVGKGVQVYMIHSLQRVPSHSGGSAHVALLSSLGYSNESNCVFALVHIMHLLLHLSPAQRRAGVSRALCTQSSHRNLQPKHLNVREMLASETDKNT